MEMSDKKTLGDEDVAELTPTYLDETESGIDFDSPKELTRSEKRISCLNIPPSPYPILVANVFFCISYAVNIVAFESMLYNKLCFRKYHDMDLCKNATFTANHPAIQEKAAVWGIYSLAAELPLAVLVNLLLASYCDKVGHKLPYLLPVIGNFLSTVYLALLTTPQFLPWDMSSIFGYSVLNTAFGGPTMILTCSFSYAAVVTPRDRIAVIMSVCEGTLLGGILIGTVINGPIIDATSLTTMTYINAGITTIPLFIIVLFVRDVTSVTEDKRGWKDILNFDRLLDAFRFIAKKRKGNTRLSLHLSFVAYTAVFLATKGLKNDFLYFVKERGMSMTEYSLFSGVMSGVRTILGPLFIYLGHRYVKADKFNMLVFSCALPPIGLILMSIDSIPNSAWIGAVFICTQTTFFGEMRALQSRMCRKDEQGQLFTYISLLMLVCGTAAEAGYKGLYYVSLTFWPGSYLAMNAFLYIFGMVTVVAIQRLSEGVTYED